LVSPPKERYVEWFTAIYTGVYFASPELKVKVKKEFGGN
jgi:hypothetical protein